MRYDTTEWFAFVYEIRVDQYDPAIPLDGR